MGNGGFDWKNYGKDYQGLNKQLGGLPEYLRTVPVQRVAQETAPELSGAEQIRRSPKTIADILGAFGAGGMLSTPGIAPLMKKIWPEGYDMAKASQEKAPIANAAGEVAGSISRSAFAPAAGAAAATKGGWIAGKSFMPMVARAGLNAAQSAVPTAISQGITTGNVKETAKDFGRNMLWGTIGGVAVEKLLSSLPRIAKAAKEVADDMVISSAGVSPRNLKGVAAGGKLGAKGATADHIRELKSSLADLITKKGLHGKEVIEEFVDDGGKLWDAVDDAFRASGAKPSQFIQEVTSDPRLQVLLNDPVYGKMVGKELRNIMARGDAIVDLSTKTGTMNPLPEIRKLLSANIKNAFKSADEAVQIKGAVSQAVHDVIDAKFVPQELKQAWPALKLLKNALAQQEARFGPLVRPGSDTAPRMFLKRMVEGTGTGAGTGALVGGYQASKDFDPRDPSTWLPALAKMGVYTVGGALLNKGFSKASNLITGRTAGMLRNLIPSAAPTAMNLPGPGPKLGASASKVLGSGAMDIMENAAPVAQAVAQSEAQASPEAVQQAREQVRAKYEEKVMDSLGRIWQTQFAAMAAPLGIDFTQFVQMVSEVTGGFTDPKKTAKIVFQDKGEREKFLADYDTALKFGSLDVGQALNYADSRWLPSLVKGGKPVESQMAYQNLMDVLSGAYGKGKEISEAERKRIAEIVKGIAGKRASPEQKRKMIEQLLSQYGVNLAQLSDFGLYGGSNG